MKQNRLQANQNRLQVNQIYLRANQNRFPSNQICLPSNQICFPSNQNRFPSNLFLFAVSKNFFPCKRFLLICKRFRLPCKRFRLTAPSGLRRHAAESQTAPDPSPIAKTSWTPRVEGSIAFDGEVIEAVQEATKRTRQPAAGKAISFSSSSRIT